MTRKLGEEERETPLVQQILLHFGARPDLRIWRSHVAKARVIGGAWLQFNVPGMADISGLRLPHGQFIQIEAKSATGKQREEQRTWQRMVERFGGLYILARSVEDVAAALGDPQ